MGNRLWLPNEGDRNKDAGKTNQIGVYVSVNAVFPDVTPNEQTLKKLLSSLSRTDALFGCARLNLIVSNPSYEHHLNKQLYCMHNFLSMEEMRGVAKFMSAHNGRLTVFFRGQLLELMRWICHICKDLPGDGTTFDDPEARRTFAKAALIVSDLWGWRTYQDKMRLDEGVDAARLRSLGTARLAYDAQSAGLDPIMAIARGRTLFLDYFVQHHPSFSDEFATKSGLDIEDYFGLLCVIAVHYLNRTPEQVAASTDKSGIFLLRYFAEKSPRLAEISEKYFSQAAQSADELCAALSTIGEETQEGSSGWRDFSAIRERPILRTEDGRAIVLDPLLFAESASAGPLFKILPRDKKAGDVILTRFGYAFESYSNSVLRRMYPSPKEYVVDRLTCNLKGQDQHGNPIEIADACLNNVDEVVLIESKATWIRDDVVEHRDPRQYVRLLHERYSRRSDNQPKGVGQLANAICKLATGEWRPINEDLSLARTIFPVLLVHDTRLDGISHAHFLANEFRDAIVADEIRPNWEMRKGQFTITPLIVLTIDTLEILERSVEHFSLADLFREYSRACPDRMMSLHNFLAFSDFGKKLHASGSLAESGLKVLDVAKGLMASGGSGEF
ncbi:MAG TPA: hypothetical protein VMM76_16240 [Pirellulaceae bacterium]|nr:hypothetical protein [Pirellulaceae bacterium]